jgi:hypothetical protein
MQPIVEADADSLRIRAGERSFVPFASSGRAGRWQLPDGVRSVARPTERRPGERRAGSRRAARRPAAGECGAIVADLSEATAIDSIDVQTNAGSASVTLPATSMDGRVQVNAGSIELCTPPEAGLRIRTGGGLGGNNFGDAGLEQSGDTWESPGYADTSAQIDLDAEANLGSITLNPDDGCDEP